MARRAVSKVETTARLYTEETKGDQEKWTQSPCVSISEKM